MTIEKKIVMAVKSAPVFNKHLYRHHWTSGSSTVVYPISLWPNEVEFQVDTHKNVFGKAINKILDKHPDLFKGGWFCKSDGSCPSKVTFKYTDQTSVKLANHE